MTPGIDVFYLRQSPLPMDAAALAADERRFRDLAKAAGLTMGPLYYDGRIACVRLVRPQGYASCRAV